MIYFYDDKSNFICYGSKTIIVLFHHSIPHKESSAMIKGVYTANVTPFTKDDTIDEAALQKLIERQISAGVSGIVPVGTTGESATLAYEEHFRVIALTAQIVRGRVQVIAGVGSNSTAETCANIKHAQKLGADAALVITPYYNRPTQAGLFQHFTRIAESSDLPIILYNVPKRTGVNLEPQTVSQLSQHENIIGIKEASGQLISQVDEIIHLCSSDFVVLSGDDASNFLVYALGGKGCISVTSNVLPKQVVALWHAHATGNISFAQELNYNLHDLNRILFCETNPIPVKAALGHMNLMREDCRLPLSTISEEHRNELLITLGHYGLV